MEKSTRCSNTWFGQCGPAVMPHAHGRLHASHGRGAGISASHITMLHERASNDYGAEGGGASMETHRNLAWEYFSFTACKLLLSAFR